MPRTALLTAASAAAVLAVAGGVIAVAHALPSGAAKTVADRASVTPSCSTCSRSTEPTYGVPSATDTAPAYFAAPGSAVVSGVAPSTSAAAPSTSSHTAPTTRPASSPQISTHPPVATRPASSHASAPAASSTTHAPAPAAPHAPSGLSGYSTGNATQLITVVAPSTGSTTATVQAWNRTSGGWAQYGAPIAAHVGSAGMTWTPSESASATPMGSFTLTQAFGIASNPGTALPYIHVGPKDYWVSDPNASCYNTHQVVGGGCSFNTGDGEQLSAAGYVYTYAVNIDYHSTRHAGGSAFFLHVSNGSPTAGCVSIPEDRLVTILHWLNPGDHPRILIGT